MNSTKFINPKAFLFRGIINIDFISYHSTHIFQTLVAVGEEMGLCPRGMPLCPLSNLIKLLLLLNHFQDVVAVLQTYSLAHFWQDKR